MSELNHICAAIVEIEELLGRYQTEEDSTADGTLYLVMDIIGRVIDSAIEQLKRAEG